MEINEAVGLNIKKYRLAHKITLEELANQIHKGKSTVSKYEKGIISIDVTTLNDIAKALGISPIQLLSIAEEHTCNTPQTGRFLEKQYMYSYDGRSKRILKSVIECYQMPDDKETGIQLFYDVKDIKEPGECKSFYAGHGRKYEFIENYSLQNQSNPTEQVWICCINSLNLTNRKLGMLTGLSYKTMLPVAIKVLISNTALKENGELVNSLLLTKEDIKISKKYNLFTIDRFME
ncbi:MAG: helix-turn-helix transcriptional regulator [Frisingicoccus sp.]|uniref:helix-turn-helix domain-containing protein n=1 Tax=Frisingicoccus sp. TaxID=1918627 RepID=UPI0026228227|nr:helix-turn-helix transcriptional regulator [Frisingicoccus sp.]MDD6232703.1 helix-turn-helix transcriptional regulator [Frisingicoccus sp.]